ncbi:Uncharacterised protein [Mycobacteroides abscessus subsp. abscessus]|nr:Uncharacterised protein [Mycobacteroides abscessus subsp. abscessus]
MLVCQADEANRHWGLLRRDDGNPVTEVARRKSDEAIALHRKVRTCKCCIGFSCMRCRLAQGWALASPPWLTPVSPPVIG